MCLTHVWFPSPASDSPHLCLVPLICVWFPSPVSGSPHLCLVPLTCVYLSLTCVFISARLSFPLVALTCVWFPSPAPLTCPLTCVCSPHLSGSPHLCLWFPSPVSGSPHSVPLTCVWLPSPVSVPLTCVYLSLIISARLSFPLVALCNETFCLNEGSCLYPNVNCTCPDGWEGDRCESGGQ